jgi:hypothetical protein
LFVRAQIGADGLELFADPMPDLLADVAGALPELGGEWVHLVRLGFRSTQRLRIADLAGGVVVATWPAELKPQATHLYGRRLGLPLVTAAVERGWTVEASPHLAYHTAPPSRRLYLRPSVDPFEYAARWEREDALRRVGSHTREEVVGELWPWLKSVGYAEDGDDAELQRFLDEFLLRRPAHMRPGLRFRRVWSREEVSSLGSRLPSVIRAEFDAVFAVAEEPALASVATQAKPSVSDPREVVVPQAARREAIPERVRHEVWRRDQGKCVDCGSRERLEFDHIIPISKGGSNTVRNLELRCEVCNRRKAASI